MKFLCKIIGHSKGWCTLREDELIFNVCVCNRCRKILRESLDHFATEYLHSQFPEGYSNTATGEPIKL